MSRPSNCKCSGVRQAKMHRWVVLVRDDRGGRLKCLQCGWRWLSRCKYVGGLPDHKERSRRGLTNEDILQRLRDETLRIHPVTAVVESRIFSPYNPKRRWMKLRQVGDRWRSGYRFVEVCVKGLKKKIGVHVLQWMARHDRVPPDGFDVHHMRSPPRPHWKSNAIDNLELKESLQNQWEGAMSRCAEDAPF